MTDPPSLPFKPSVTSPYPGQTYSVGDDISLVGSAFDYSTNTAASLQWSTENGPIPDATGQQAHVSAATLTVGSHTIRLAASAGSKSASVDVPITISDDADGDGITAPREDVIHQCAVLKGITDGGDHDPTNGSKDYDNDGIPNRDDPFPCTPAGSYMASAAIFLPSKLSLTKTTSLSAGGMLVPFRDMTQVSVPRNQLPPVFIKQIDLGEQGTIDVNEQASAYAASGSIGAATFGTQPLIGILSSSSKPIVNRSINLIIQGTGTDPLSGPWTFTAIVSTYVIP